MKTGKIFQVSWTTIKRAKQLAGDNLASIVVSFIANTRELNQALIGGFAVLPDEVNVIISPKGNHSCEAVTRYIKRASERLINRELNRTGEVWDPAVHEIHIKDEAALSEAVRKIEYLPCKYGIVKYPSEYKHSSANRDFVKDDLSDLFLPQHQAGN